MTYDKHDDPGNSNGSNVLSSTNFEEDIDADYDMQSFDTYENTSKRRESISNFLNNCKDKRLSKKHPLENKN